MEKSINLRGAIFNLNEKGNAYQYKYVFGPTDRQAQTAAKMLQAQLKRLGHDIVNIRDADKFLEVVFKEDAPKAQEPVKKAVKSSRPKNPDIYPNIGELVGKRARFSPYRSKQVFEGVVCWGHKQARDGVEFVLFKINGKKYFKKIDSIEIIDHESN